MLQIGIYTASYTKYTQNAVLHILLTCCGHLLPPRTFIQNLWQPQKKKKEKDKWQSASSMACALWKLICSKQLKWIKQNFCSKHGCHNQY